MKTYAKIILFIISYVPLYLIFCIQKINDKVFVWNEKERVSEFVGIIKTIEINYISIGFLALIVFSVLLYYFFFHIIKHGASEGIEVKEIKSTNLENLTYLTNYLLPFIGLQFDTWQSVLASFCLFTLLGSIYIKTNMILTNPTLSLFGYNISKVVSTNDKIKIIIHKGRNLKKEYQNGIPIIDNIYLKPYDKRSNH